MASIIMNVSYMTVANIVLRALTFVFFLIISRVLGVEGVGEYAFVFAFVTLFAIFNDMGISTLFVREEARTKNKSLFGMVLPLRFILAFITTTVIIIAITFSGRSDTVITATYIAAIAIFFPALKEISLSVFQAQQRIWVVSLVTIIESFLTVTLGIIFVFSGFGVIGISTAYLISYATVAIISIVAAMRAVPFKLELSTRKYKAFLAASIPFWLTAVLITLSFRIDTVMLEFIRGSIEVGIYNASFRFLDALYFIPGSIILALFPAMSKLHHTDKARLKEVYRKAFYYLFMIALPMGVGASLLAPRIIQFLYGNEFAESAVVLQLLIWAEAAIFLFTVPGFLFNAIDRQKTYTLVAFFATIINISLNALFIPLYGFQGAAITTVITQWFTLIGLLYKAHAFGFSLNYVSIAVKPAVASVLMAAVIFLLHPYHIIFIMPAAVIAYGLVILILKGIEREELVWAKSLLRL